MNLLRSTFTGPLPDALGFFPRSFPHPPPPSNPSTPRSAAANSAFCSRVQFALGNPSRSPPSARVNHPPNTSSPTAVHAANIAAATSVTALGGIAPFAHSSNAAHRRAAAAVG